MDIKNSDLSAIQNRYYKKAINNLRSIFDLLCNANGPLNKYEYQSKVITIIQETETKIDKLVQTNK